MRSAGLHSLGIVGHHCLRRLLRVRLLGMISDIEIHHHCQAQPIPQWLQTRRLQWFDHAADATHGSMSAMPTCYYLFPDATSDSVANCEHGSGQSKPLQKFSRTLISTVFNARNATSFNLHKNSPKTWMLHQVKVTTNSRDPGLVVMRGEGYLNR